MQADTMTCWHCSAEHPRAHHDRVVYNGPRCTGRGTAGAWPAVTSSHRTATGSARSGCAESCGQNAREHAFCSPEHPGFEASWSLFPPRNDSQRALRACRRRRRAGSRPNVPGLSCGRVPCGPNHPAPASRSRSERPWRCACPAPEGHAMRGSRRCRRCATGTGNPRRHAPGAPAGRARLPATGHRWNHHEPLAGVPRARTARCGTQPPRPHPRTCAASARP